MCLKQDLKKRMQRASPAPWEDVGGQSPGCHPDPEWSPGCHPDLGQSPGCHSDRGQSPGCHPGPGWSPGCHPDPGQSRGCHPDPEWSPGCHPGQDRSQAVTLIQNGHKDNLQQQLGLQVATKPPRKPLQEGVNN
uniref:Uncharacterized protein n=1 Tax=Zonotrichia albicollis TaxID=44394 RepID=A0A8D2QAK4_ZONAL